MAATAVSVVGSVIALLAATATATAAGGLDRGAMYAGVYMALVLVASALALPYAPRYCFRLGTRRSFAGAQSLAAIAWLLAGTLLLLGVAPMPVLLVAAPFFGAFAGTTTVLKPALAKAYLATPRVSTSQARMSVVSGVAWAAGAMAGGTLLNSVALGWGLVINGVLSMPLALIVLRITPTVAVHEPVTRGRPWHDIRVALSESAPLRAATVLGCAMTLFLFPMVSLIVPITQQLRHEPLLIGAGLLIATMGIGEMFSPLILRALSAGRDEFPAATVSAALAGGTLIAFGVTSLVLSDVPELVAWAIIGLALGALNYATKALAIGAAAESRGPEQATRSLASCMLVVGLFAPIGVLAWSLLISGFSAVGLLLLACGCGTIVLGLLLNHNHYRRASRACNG